MLQRLDVEPLQDPIQALVRVTSEVIGLKDWLAGEFAAARAEHQLMLAELLGRALDRAAALLVRLHQLGLAELRAQMDEDLARGMADACRGIVSDLGHDPAVPEVRAIVRRNLLLIEAREAAS